VPVDIVPDAKSEANEKAPEKNGATALPVADDKTL